MKNRKTVAGSEKKRMPSASVVGKVDPEERIEITVLIRRRTSSGTVQARTKEVMDTASLLPEQRQYPSREEFSAQHGADPADLVKIDMFAHAHNLTVVETSIPQRTVKLSGTIADLTAAFGSNLKKYKIGKRIFRGRTGSINVPKELADIVAGVFGLDNRPAARPHCRYLDEIKAAHGRLKISTRKIAVAKAGKKNGPSRVKKISPKNAPDGSFKPPEVARLYKFPAGLDGTGQCIALIELNDLENNGKISGTGFIAADLTAYFSKLNIPIPQVTAVGVDGGANKPGPDPNADGEVMLDIEVAGAVAPGARIVVYFAPNTDKGFIDAINYALHDSLRKPSVISISWGSSEDAWTPQSMEAFNQVLQDAATLGVTVCCASGDNGSSDLPLADRQGNTLQDNQPHVDFPASSPFALACGGTKLIGSGTIINSEEVWNEGDSGGAGGGGVSNFFALPSYQTLSKVPRSPKGKKGRGVPDVAGNADPATGYQVMVSSKPSVIGGTSAVAPLWAGMITLINQRLESLGKNPVGFMNPILYRSPGLLYDVVKGNNDIDGTLHKYRARAGWDPCTGLGTPEGTKIMQAFGG